MDINKPNKFSGWDYMFPNSENLTSAERYNSGQTNGIFFFSENGITVLTGAWTILFGTNRILMVFPAQIFS